MKTYYSVEDIESFAAQRQREIYIDENIVLTDLAKQTAQMLGIHITVKPSGASAGAFNPAHSQSAGKMHAFSGKPKGCQSRPAGKPTPVSGASAGQSRQVVDKLVEKIKRISGNNE